jgi:hypothetical protein
VFVGSWSALLPLAVSRFAMVLSTAPGCAGDVVAQCALISVIGEQEVLVPSYESPCMGLVVLEPAEFAHITANPFVLTVEQGLGLSVAIAAVWAVAWGWKALGRVVSQSGGSSSLE